MQHATCVRTWLLAVVFAFFAGATADAQSVRAPLLTVPSNPGASVFDSAISPNGDMIVQKQGNDSAATVVSLRTGRQVAAFKVGSPIVDIYFCPDNKTLAWFNKAGHAVFRDIASGKERSFPINKADHQVSGDFVFSPDGKHLYAKGLRSLWEIESGKGVGTMPYRLNHYSCYFTPDGATLVTTTGDSQDITLYDAATLKEKKTLTPKGVKHSLISPDGKTLVLCCPSRPKSQHNEIVLWDIADDKEVSRFACDTGNSSVVHPMAFSPDGKILAVRGGPGEQTFVPDKTLSSGKRYVNTTRMLFHEFPSGKQIGTFTAPMEGFDRMVYAADGKALVARLGGKFAVFAVHPLK